MKVRVWTATAGLLLLLAVPALALADSKVTDDSPTTPFPQSKQNEPYVAIDPTNPLIVAAGANEEVDQPPCDGADCPFAPGIGTSGIYFSFNGGTSWAQPTYDGWSGRTGTLEEGDIGTLPNYFENGLISDGDPVLLFGPQPDNHGDFDWDNGSRLYYVNLTANFASRRKEFNFKGVEALAVSYADDLTAAAAGDETAWSDPVVATRRQQSSATFSDKEDIGIDDASSSPYFGNVYVCYSRFQSIGSEPDSIFFTRSTDGGDTWANPQRFTAYFNSPAQPGRQGCQVATDSEGVVYVVWEDTVNHRNVFKMKRSFDGGVTFEKKSRTIAQMKDVGIFDSVRSISFDGVAGARTGSFPSLSIANGAPTGAGAPDTLAVGWSDGADGLNDEHALVQMSDDQGVNWTDPVEAEVSTDRPDFAFIGLSPNGEDLYVVYDAFLDPFRSSVTSATGGNVIAGNYIGTDVSGTTVGAFTTLHRGGVGDGRASSANALIDEFLGDYNSAWATNSGVFAAWNDVRDTSLCPAVITWRQTIVDGSPTAQPAFQNDCPDMFGASSIYGGWYTP